MFFFFAFVVVVVDNPCAILKRELPVTGFSLWYVLENARNRYRSICAVKTVAVRLAITISCDGRSAEQKKAIFREENRLVALDSDTWTSCSATSHSIQRIPWLMQL